ncbi:hypothetical protein Tco_0747502 [Tanacetum coccineum]|uniref:Uncharacterized protein n=1 Tax=Tanacetum coccineum TaxID=301880 RepID=A0ABQ4YTW9_9ASTR
MNYLMLSVSDYDNFGPALQLQKTFVHNSTELRIQDHSNETSSSKLVLNVVPTAYKTNTSLQELELLFSPMYEEYFIARNQSVSKYSALYDNLQQQDTQPTLNVQPTIEPVIPPTDFNVKESNNDQAEDAEFEAYGFINPLCKPVQEVAEPSSRNIDTLNMHAFYQLHRSDYQWTKNHPLEQVHRNPSKSSKDIVGKRELILKNLLRQSHDWKLFGFVLPTMHTNHLYIPDGHRNGFFNSPLKEEVYHGMDKCVSIGTPMATSPKLDADLIGDKLVSWMSKKQDCTAMSMAEAEYVALCASYAQVLWMRIQVKDYGFDYNKIPLYYNPVQHSRTKHINFLYHFIKEQVENGIVELYFVITEYQLADMFTKSLSKERFEYLVGRLGMRCLTPV